MGIDSALFWSNLFLYFFEPKYIKQILSNGSSKVCKYHGFSRFIEDLCALNYNNQLSTSLKNIYRKKLKLKVDHKVIMPQFRISTSKKNIVFSCSNSLTKEISLYCL